MGVQALQTRLLAARCLDTIVYVLELNVGVSGLGRESRAHLGRSSGQSESAYISKTAEKLYLRVLTWGLGKVRQHCRRHG